MSQYPLRGIALVVLAALVISTLKAPAQASPISSSRHGAVLADNSTTRSPAFMTRAGADARTPALFVSDDETNAVYILNPDNINGAPLGKITDSINTPTTLYVDGSGVLYVNNTLNNRNYAALYQPGSVHPSRIIRFANTLGGIVTVALDRSVVIESQQSQLFSSAVLHIFDKGSSTETRKVTISLNGNDFVRVRGAAFDAAGNLFLSVARYPTPGGMFEVPAGSTQAVQVATDPGFGEAFDAAGNLYVSFGSAIVEFDHETQHVTRLITDGLIDVLQSAVTPDGRIFAPSVETFDFSRNQDIPGNLIEYGSQSIHPRQLTTNLVDPQGAAFRP
ncbi:MAG TPA: hypothetical protein VFO25_13665 [Candidatus Eremiobacteraceae bacterium]|nr:hypothetical protein [Candidatus Eremiobacteraceae bacterium]